MAKRFKIRKRINEPERSLVFKRDKYICGYCGLRKKRSSLQIDHIIPVIYGGFHGVDNFVTACRSCNRKKWNFAPKEEGSPKLCYFKGRRVAKCTWLAKGKRFPKRIPKISFFKR